MILATHGHNNGDIDATVAELKEATLIVCCYSTQVSYNLPSMAHKFTYMTDRAITTYVMPDEQSQRWFKFGYVATTIFGDDYIVLTNKKGFDFSWLNIELDSVRALD